MTSHFLAGHLIATALFDGSLAVAASRKRIIPFVW
jgi:hypothetical protein